MLAQTPRRRQLQTPFIYFTILITDLFSSDCGQKLLLISQNMMISTVFHRMRSWLDCRFFGPASMRPCVSALHRRSDFLVKSPKEVMRSLANLSRLALV